MNYNKFIIKNGRKTEGGNGEWMYLVKGSRPVRRRRTEMVEERGEERRLFGAKWREGDLNKGELEEGVRRVLPLEAVEADKEERWWEVLTALLSNKWLLLLHIFLSLFVVAVEKPLASLIIEPSITLTLFTLICSADPFPKSSSLFLFLFSLIIFLK